MDRTHTGKFDGESVRGRQAECAVRRQILSPGTAKLRRVLRTKQPKRSRGSGLPFASPLRRAQQKQGTATTRGKEFLTCAAGRNGFPLERVVFDTPNNAGAGRMADPRRGTLSFVTQKFFCFGAINNRRNMVLFLFAATSDGCFTRARRWSLAPARPLYHLPVWCPGGVISKID